MIRRLLLLVSAVVLAVACTDRVYMPYLDFWPPFVRSVQPADEESGVDRFAEIRVEFSEALEPDTVDGNSFIVQHGEVPIAGVVAFEGSSATFSPAVPFSYLSTYVATVTTAMKDHVGWTLSSSHSWSFTVRDLAWGESVPLSSPGVDATEGSVDAVSDHAAVAWRESDGSRTNIWMSRWRSQTGWTPAGLVDVEDLGDALAPDVAVDPAGNAILVWLQDDGTRYNVWARIIDATGTFGPAEVIEIEDGAASNASVASDPSGNAIAVWTQFDGTRRSPRAALYVPGSGWGSPTGLQTAGPMGDAFDLTLAFSGEGRAIALWSQRDSAGTSRRIWANHFVLGAGWSGSVMVNGTTEPLALQPALAFDGAGVATAAWAQGVEGSSGRRIWAARYVPEVGWQTPQPIEADATEYSALPDVAADPGGNVLVSWLHKPTALDPGDVRANSYTLSSGWMGDVPLEDSLLDASSPPNVAIDERGNGLALWHQHRDSLYTLIQCRFLNGIGWSDCEPVEFDAPGSDLNGRLAMIPDGSSVAVWVRNDGVSNGVRARHFQ